jgi:hypothetical protein
MRTRSLFTLVGAGNQTLFLASNRGAKVLSR